MAVSRFEPRPGSSEGEFAYLRADRPALHYANIMPRGKKMNNLYLYKNELIFETDKLKIMELFIYMELFLKMIHFINSDNNAVHL